MEPLKDVMFFKQFSLHPNFHTLVWPNGADFDPATLHDWPRLAPELESMARRWAVTANEQSPANKRLQRTAKRDR